MLLDTLPLLRRFSAALAPDAAAATPPPAFRFRLRYYAMPLRLMLRYDDTRHAAAIAAMLLPRRFS